MSKAEDRALEAYPSTSHYWDAEPDRNAKAREYYKQGYKQAEKDLLESKHEKSWRLDEKLWKGINDIEEASYQYMYDASNDWAYDNPTWEDVQDAFKAGSEWKEELTLTWRDMELIYHLSDEIPAMAHDDFFKELLRRYNEKKKELV